VPTTPRTHTSRVLRRYSQKMDTFRSPSSGIQTCTAPILLIAAGKLPQNNFGRVWIAVGGTTSHAAGAFMSTSVLRSLM